MLGRLPRAVLIAVLSSAAVVSLSACTPDAAPQPAPATSAAATAPGSTAPTAAGAAYVPGGSADQNLPFFDAVNNGVISSATAANTTPDGKTFTSALRDGGFDIAAMQVTPDTTTVGVKADTIQFSVALGGQCLIGQYGFGEYRSLVVPLLGTGKCLVGETRAIDW